MVTATKICWYWAAWEGFICGGFICVSPPLCVLHLTGIPSTTHSELFMVLSGLSPVSSGNSTEALRVLNDRAAGLHGVLTSQSSDDNKLIVANALWTKSLTLLPSYPAQMKALFGVSAWPSSKV